MTGLMGKWAYTSLILYSKPCCTSTAGSAFVSRASAKWQMGAHLGDTSEHVANHRLDGTQASDVLTGSVPDSEDDLRSLLRLDLVDSE